jgi:N utilization substance protein B
LPHSRCRIFLNDSMSRTRVETRARARALQALYAWDMRGSVGNLERVAEQMWDDIVIAADVRALAQPIVRHVSRNLVEIDELLADVTTNWRMERLGAIERCVLRVGAAELTLAQTPPKVVIQEFVMLSERFASAASAKFVNGVLDALARRMGRM